MVTPLTEKCIQKIIKNLKHYPPELVPIIKEFEVSKHDFAEVDQRWVYAQNLQTLSLPILHLQKIFHDQRNNELEPIEHNNDKIPVDIAKVLKLLLNPESQKSLIHLSIKGGMLTFKTGWIEEIRPLLPALTDLNLTGCTLDSEDFKQLCSYFPKLQKLNISETAVTSLRQVGLLGDLQVLVMCGLEIENKMDFLELASIQLKVLDISGSTFQMHSNTLRLYLASSVLMPHLRFIDCSLNEITPPMLFRLMVSHPALVKISLIGTDLSKLKQIIKTKKDLTFFKTGTLREAMEALKFYWFPFQDWKCYQVFYSVFSMFFEKGPEPIPRYALFWLDDTFPLSQARKKLKPDDIRYCVDELLDLSNPKKDSEEARAWIVVCLNELCKEDQIQVLSIAKRNQLIRSALEIAHVTLAASRNHPENSTQVDITLTQVWLLLSNALKSVPTEENIRLLSPYFISVSTETRLDHPDAAECCFELINLFLDEIPAHVLDPYFRYHLLLEHALIYIDIVFLDSDLFVTAIRLMVRLNRNNPYGRDTFLNREVIVALIRCLSYCIETQQNVVLVQIFDALQDFIHNSYLASILPIVRGMNWIIFFQCMIRNTNASLKSRLVSLSVTFYLRTRQYTGLSWEEYNEVKNRYTNDIMKIITEKEDEFYGIDGLNGLDELSQFFITSTESEEIRNWALSFFEHR